MTRIVIVGGVAAGASCACRARRLDESAEIIVLERGPYVSFANCGLPYFVGGAIIERSKLTLQTPESLKARFAIDVRINCEAYALDTDDHQIGVRDHEKGTTYTLAYDKLLLAPGARPIIPKLPGTDLAEVMAVRSIPDIDRVCATIERGRAKRICVVGGGFVGVEMCENLIERGLEVTLLEKAPQLIASLDFEMACDVHREVRKAGVTLMLNEGLAAIERVEDGLSVRTDQGNAVGCDAVILAIGVTPDTAIAKEAGIVCKERGHIVVDEYLRTSAEDVYAAGDAIQVTEYVSGNESAIPLAGPANRQGRIAAENMCGGERPYRDTLASSIVKVFSLAAASTGLTERAARQAGIEVDKCYLTQPSHATYYPGAKMMGLKVIWEKGTGRLIGAQATGPEGVDKRIDVIACALRLGADVRDLAGLELCYAPPFSSAKDPVNIAGLVAENVLAGLVTQFFPEDVAGLPRDGSVTLLDVRTPREHAAGSIPGFINIPVDELRAHISELDPKKPVYVHCKSGQRSYIACRILAGSGFEPHNLSGGYDRWSAYVAG